jgi:hypothetical protein
MGLFESIGTAVGTNSAGHSLPYRPLGRQQYDKYRLQDIRQLHGPNAFKGPGLGYTDEEMQAGIGGSRDYLAGERAAESQETADRFRRPGGFGTSSGLYERTLQGVRLNHQNQLAEAARAMTLENARQSRADQYARIAAVTGGLQDAAGLWNQRMGVKRSLAVQKGQAVGSAVDEAIKLAAGGV